MPSQLHKEAASRFEARIVMLAQEMNVNRQIAKCGATLMDTLNETSRQTDPGSQPATGENSQRWH
ncbi:hypothetical protein N7447_007993 [Penicillium robsamsonii]|uniref:uncharacterized protein n=1 Tax=Penicillium robsamsonii TaxID=1792511 RepID=UPI00254695BE|nr:uncharacterized protein N7447_007993 [Penicillium robsamsonii]KAJ5817985.1 hypothetical protein N7447_007993 [Penicillium robsamsonii]